LAPVRADGIQPYSYIDIYTRDVALLDICNKASLASLFQYKEHSPAFTYTPSIAHYLRQNGLSCCRYTYHERQCSVNNFGCCLMNNQRALLWHVPIIKELPIFMSNVDSASCTTPTNEHQQSVNRASTKCQQSVNRISTEHQQSVNRISTEHQQSINRASTEHQQGVNRASMIFIMAYFII